jgi:hypothetical protein
MASSSCGSRRFPPPWSAEETDAFCFRGIRLRRLERDFPAIRCTSASHHFSFDLSTLSIASSMQRRASLGRPSSG